MKVGILLSGRFPTEKAYGVTTNGTVKSLMEMGHEVVVFGLKSSYQGEIPESNKFTVQHYKENMVSLFLKKISFSDYGNLNQIAWKLYWILAKQLNKNKIAAHEFDLIWIRDMHMLKFSNRARDVVIEIHQRIKNSDTSRLVKNSRTKNLLVAPISRILLSDMSEIRADLNIVYSPMGIDPKIISNRKSTKLFISELLNWSQTKLRKLQIGYIGKFYPNGYSKGIEDLLELSRINAPLSELFNISLTGGTEREIIKLKKAITEKQIKFQYLQVNPHVPHAHALEKMKNLDVIVLPKPDSDDYLGFPLKSIEAVASGRIVVAAKCRTYIDVFSDSFKPFWYEPGDANSLYDSIVQALSDTDLEARINTGLAFAKQFSWEARTKNILSKLFNKNFD